MLKMKTIKIKTLKTNSTKFDSYQTRVNTQFDSTTLDIQTLSMCSSSTQPDKLGFNTLIPRLWHPSDTRVCVNINL